MKQYIKAKQRIIETSGNKNITDAQIIERLENEIEYYRNKIGLLEQVREEDRRYINKQNELIKEYQETFKEVIINKIDILNSRTPNQIRMLLGLDEVNKRQTKDTLIKIKEAEQSTCPKIEIWMNPSG